MLRNVSEDLEMSEMEHLYYNQVDKKFILLTNKMHEKLGFFIVQFSEDNTSEHSFLIKWNNKLNIGDAFITLCFNSQTGYKELVISYKVIYINVYNVLALDISHETN